MLPLRITFDSFVRASYVRFGLLAALEATISRVNCGDQKTKGLAMDDTLKKLKAKCEERKGRFMGL